MPRRNDIPKITIIGSGPIVIGQACEFDYSGTQACKAPRALGFAKDFHKRSLAQLLDLLSQPTGERQFLMYEAVRKGATTEQLRAKTFIKPCFIDQMRERQEMKLLRYPAPSPPPQDVRGRRPWRS
jgi:hypothetical protein